MDIPSTASSMAAGSSPRSIVFRDTWTMTMRFARSTSWWSRDLRRLTVPTSTGAEEVLGRFVTELKASGHYQEEDIQIHTKFVPDKDVLPVINIGVHGRNRGPLQKRMHRELWIWYSSTGGISMCRA